jgi:Kef-type K+ transport system membrane component KefB/nucleotide-binding universal stress UspA family protein
MAAPVLAALLHDPLPRLLFQVALIVGVARLLGLLARHLGQPTVIAEIIAGILLGPTAFGVIAPELFAALFPPESLPVLGLVSQLGLVLFMFLIGLEFDPKLLVGRAHASIAISHTSIVVPFGLGIGLSLLLFADLAGSQASDLGFALFMGAAMSITAFPVLARILSERRLLRTRLGSLTLTCAAVDDVTAWCLLAFVVALSRSRGVESAVFTTGATFVYIGLMWFAVRPLLARLASRASRPDALSQNTVAVILLILIVSSLVTEAIGIHALFGAFLLGVVMPKTGTIGATLAGKLEEVVLVLLLPLFFAYSGLRTEIGLVHTATDWLVCGAIVLCACGGKMGAGTIAARLTGSSWRDAMSIGALMNTRGLMELIVLNIGLDLGVIGPKLFAMMVLMALVTTFMTTPLLRLLKPSEEGARTPASSPVWGTPSKPDYCVLVCIADERVGHSLATLSRALCFGGGERVVALNLTAPPERRLFAELEDEQPPSPLAPMLGRARALNLEVESLSFVSSDPAEDICNVAREQRAHLVLLGGHRPVIGQSLLGGTVRSVLKAAPTDTGVLIDRGLHQLRRVLLPFLGSPHDATALALARRFVEGSGAELVVLELRDVDRPGIDVLGSLATWVERTSGVSHRVVVTESAFEVVMAELEHNYDLLIVGLSRDLGLDPRPLGLQGERLLDETPVSILVVQHGKSQLATVASTDAVPKKSLEHGS